MMSTTWGLVVGITTPGPMPRHPTTPTPHRPVPTLPQRRINTSSDERLEVTSCMPIKFHTLPIGNNIRRVRVFYEIAFTGTFR